MSAPEKMITLKSSDGDLFELPEEVARESQTIKHLIEDVCADNSIPLPNVHSKILAKIVTYLKRHVEARKSNEDLKSFDAEFVKVDQATLFDIILAANYLDIKNLLDLACQNVAEMINESKTVEEIRRTFNIENDFEPGEEEKFRRENGWAFKE